MNEDLDASLIDRRSKHAMLTEAGRLLVTHGERIVHVIAEAEAAVRLLVSEARTHVVVGVTETTVSVLLPAIGCVRRTRPELEIAVRHVPASHAAPELRAGTIQLGVWACASEPPPSSIRLGTDEMVALMHPSHPLAKATFLTLGQLDAKRC